MYFRLPPGSRLNGVTQDHFLGYDSGFVYFEGDDTARQKLIDHYFVRGTHGYSKKNIMLYGQIKQSKTKSVGYLHIGSTVPKIILRVLRRFSRGHAILRGFLQNL